MYILNVHPSSAIFARLIDNNRRYLTLHKDCTWCR